MNSAVSVLLRSLALVLGGLHAVPLLAQENLNPFAQGGLTSPLRAASSVAIRGAKSFSDAQIRGAQAQALQEIQEQGASPARADDLAFYIGLFYRKAGFSKSQVDYEIHPGQVVIKIEEGPRTLLRRIVFEGNRSEPDATLFEYMIGAPAESLAREPSKFPYTATEIGAGADRVRGLYLSEGFLKVAVEPSEARFSADGTRADVTLHIAEGPRYMIGEIQFVGPARFSREELIAALGIPSSGPFTQQAPRAMEQHLQSFYRAHGYYQAKVTATADLAPAQGGKIGIRLAVTPGELFHFGHITIRNETERPRLRPSFLQHRLAPLRDQTYEAAKLDEVYREMLRTGLFENLRITPEAVGRNELRLHVTAREAKAKELGFTVGAGSYEGASVGLRLGDRDLFGRGRPLSFSADYSQRGLRGELLYVDPWLFDTRMTLRARLYAEAREEIGYSKNRQGARLDLGRKFLPHLEIGSFLEAAQVRTKPLEIPPELIGPLNYGIGTIGLTQNSDFRNDPLNPRRGFVINSSVELSTLDRGTSFVRTTGRVSYYLPIGKTMLAFGARGGLLSAPAHEIPIDDRFFNGGANTVRSFAERELGPKDKGGAPLGGDLFTVFNLEYTFPLARGFEAAAFVDAGSLRNNDAPMCGDLRYGIGVGLRYKLPIGPLRLDYGINPDRRPGEDFGAFHFSFGFAF